MVRWFFDGYSHWPKGIIIDLQSQASVLSCTWPLACAHLKRCPIASDCLHALPCSPNRMHRKLIDVNDRILLAEAAWLQHCRYLLVMMLSLYLNCLQHIVYFMYPVPIRGERWTCVFVSVATACRVKALVYNVYVQLPIRKPASHIVFCSNLCQLFRIVTRTEVGLCSLIHHITLVSFTIEIRTGILWSTEQFQGNDAISHF